MEWTEGTVHYYILEVWFDDLFSLEQGGGGGKAGAKPSKKDVIMEANKNAKTVKIADGEKAKIKFGLQQGKNVS